MSKERKEKILRQKCVYYNGKGKCAFAGISRCIHPKGMIPFPYVCNVELQIENQWFRD